MLWLIRHASPNLQAPLPWSRTKFKVQTLQIWPCLLNEHIKQPHCCCPPLVNLVYKGPGHHYQKSFKYQSAIYHDLITSTPQNYKKLHINTYYTKLHIQTHNHTHMHARTHARTHTHAHTHLHTHTQTHIYTPVTLFTCCLRYTYTHTHTCEAPGELLCLLCLLLTEPNALLHHSEDNIGTRAKQCVGCFLVQCPVFDTAPSNGDEGHAVLVVVKIWTRQASLPRILGELSAY